MAQRTVCGVPVDKCTGSNVGVNKSMHVKKTHESPVQAFKCMRKYLLDTGHVQIGSREFRPPDGSETIVMTKKSHYGAQVRKGKTGDAGAGRRAAFMDVGGTIISM